MNETAWMAVYGKQVRQLITNLEYFALQGSSDGKLNLRHNVEMLKSAFAEIQRLNVEIENLKAEINKLMDQIPSVNNS